MGNLSEYRFITKGGRVIPIKLTKRRKEDRRSSIKYLAGGGALTLLGGVGGEVLVKKSESLNRALKNIENATLFRHNTGRRPLKSLKKISKSLVTSSGHLANIGSKLKKVSLVGGSGIAGVGAILASKAYTAKNMSSEERVIKEKVYESLAFASGIGASLLARRVLLKSRKIKILGKPLSKSSKLRRSSIDRSYSYPKKFPKVRKKIPKINPKQKSLF